MASTQLLQEVEEALYLHANWTRYLTAAVVLVLWDWLLMIDVEVERIWMSKRRLVVALWLVVRYLPILSLIPTTALMYDALPKSVCEPFGPFAGAVLLVNSTVQHVVFITRTYCLYRRDRRVLVGLSLLLLVELVFYIRGMVRAPPNDTPEQLAKLLPGCMPLMFLKPDGLAVWLSSFAVDFSVLLLTVVKTIRLHRAKESSSILTVMLRDGVAYFAIIAIANVLNLVMFLTEVQGKLNPVQFSIVFSGILTPRLVLNLRSAVRPKDDDFWTRAARPQVTDDKFTSLTAMEVELDETTTYQDGDSYSQCRGDGEVEYLSG